MGDFLTPGSVNKPARGCGSELRKERESEKSGIGGEDTFFFSKRLSARLQMLPPGGHYLIRGYNKQPKAALSTNQLSDQPM